MDENERINTADGRVMRLMRQIDGLESIGRTMNKRAVFVAMLSVLFIAITCGFIAIMMWASPGFTPLVFNKNAWREANTEERGYMVDDLLAKHTLRALLKNQLVDLLGEPDEDQKELLRYRYHLGRMGRNPDAWFLTDYSLLIKFDAQDVVIGAHVAD